MNRRVRELEPSNQKVPPLYFERRQVLIQSGSRKFCLIEKSSFDVGPKKCSDRRLVMIERRKG